VRKQYGAAAALDGIDLAFPNGETSVLIGPSGCGKSTVLRLLVGLIEPTAGEVELLGRPVRPDSVLELRRRVGYVIQDGGLFPHLTARGNVELMGRHLRRPAEELRRRLAELCELAHFPQDALDRFPNELSGGQRQRVGLMRALLLDPEVLFLDEPLAALDPMVRASLQTELREIFARLKKTVILVTHDMAEAAYLGGRLVLMRAGRVVQEGTIEDLQRRPAVPFVTEFLEAQRSVVTI
jgi:osmoprotectant transport system ATP-binding protein